MLKAYYVIRTDLNMPASKLAVQVGHGTQLLMNYVESNILDTWEQISDSRKIVCTCSTEEKLLNLLHRILPCIDVLGCTIIEDSGYTFFKERTKTGLVFMADVENIKDETVVKAIKRLQTWKD